MINCIISRNSLFKILILEINDKSYFFLDILKKLIYFWFTRPRFYFKLLKLMLTFIYLYVMIFIFSLIVFVSNRKHLLITLISLEFIVLIVYLFIYVFLNYISLDFYFSIIFLTFRVCEGALGLSIIVSLIRTHGNDYFQTYNVLQC